MKKHKTLRITLYDDPCVISKAPAKGLGLSLLYHSLPGRALLKVLTNPAVSNMAGHFMDSPYSKWIIPAFVRQNHIKLDDFEKTNTKDYANFNEFFIRQIRRELRPLCTDPEKLASPCDGLLRVYPIREGMVIPVKESKYSIKSLLRDSELAAAYEGGYCLVFRLCVNHYHRYHFPDDGSLEICKKIPGILHTVQPIALLSTPVFTENSREYALLHTEHFGDVIQMEVGAMLVGRISNHLHKKRFARGEEKGYFQYGGSTVILLVQKDKVKIPKKVLRASGAGYEVNVKMGQAIAESR